LYRIYAYYFTVVIFHCSRVINYKWIWKGQIAVHIPWISNLHIRWLWLRPHRYVNLSAFLSQWTSTWSCLKFATLVLRTFSVKIPKKKSSKYITTAFNNLYVKQGISKHYLWTFSALNTARISDCCYISWKRNADKFTCPSRKCLASCKQICRQIF